MVTSMKRREVEQALTRNGCSKVSEDGIHTKWECSCGLQHQANIPRHREISPGVVRDTRTKMACLPRGWLQ